MSDKVSKWVMQKLYEVGSFEDKSYGIWNVLSSVKTDPT